MKVGDKVIVKSKYFNAYNDHTGVVEEVIDKQHEILVRFDEEWSVDSPKVFDKWELKLIKP